MSLFLSIVFGATGVYLLLTKKTIAPWFPTRKKDFPRINGIADLKPGEVLYELGCGDGRVCNYLAKQNPEVKVVGIESFTFVYLVARLRKFLSGAHNLELRLGDVYKEDLSPADALYTFAIVESINGKLKEKILKEMKQEARLISYTFSIKDWPGTVEVDDSSDFGLKVNVYKK